LIRPPLLALPVLLAIAAPVSAQDAEGWGTGAHMGTAYAGLTNAEGAHLGVYCAENVAPQGAQAIRTGAYVLFSLPRKLALEAKPVPVTFTVDGKATAVPMAVTAEEVATSFDWGPVQGVHHRPDESAGRVPAPRQDADRQPGGTGSDRALHPRRLRRRAGEYPGLRQALRDRL
jgi:hypothetical protein